MNRKERRRNKSLEGKKEKGIAQEPHYVFNSDGEIDMDKSTISLEQGRRINELIENTWQHPEMTVGEFNKKMEDIFGGLCPKLLLDGKYISDDTLIADIKEPMSKIH